MLYSITHRPKCDSYLCAPPNLIITLQIDVAGEILVPAEVLLPAGQTQVFFAVTNLDDALLDGPRQVTVTASAAGFSDAAGVVINQDDEVAQLTVILPEVVREGSGVLVGFGQIKLDRAPATNFLVSLSSSDTNDLQVSSVVWVGAGQTSVGFNVTALDNVKLDGMRAVSVAATAPNALPGRAQIQVTDNESLNVNLRLQPWGDVEEGRGTVTNGMTISLSGLAVSNIVISLTSSDPSELQVPPTVVIAAGEKQVVTDYVVLDDAVSDGRQDVTVSVHAPGFPDTAWGVWNLGVRDDELDRFFVVPLPAAQQAAQPFPVTVYAHTIDGYVPSTYQGYASLRATGHAGAVELSPSVIGPFTNGIWSGMVTVGAESRGTQLFIKDEQDHSGASSLFDVAAITIPGVTIYDMVYDAQRHQIVASVPAVAETQTNSIVGIDPTTGGVGLELAPGR